MMRKYISNFQQKFTAENQRMYDEQKKSKEGEISINYVNKDHDRPSRQDEGEYVDFEEIK